jgi:hypothetical protein
LSDGLKEDGRDSGDVEEGRKSETEGEEKEGRLELLKEKGNPSAGCGGSFVGNKIKKIK